MKLFFGFAVFIWLLCGFIGAWILDGGGHLHWKAIAKGPITLVHAINENPMTFPGP